MVGGAPRGGALPFRGAICRGMRPSRLERAEALAHFGTRWVRAGWVKPSCLGAHLPSCPSPPQHPAPEFDAYAFKEGDDYSLAEFESIAANFEKQWWGSEAKAARQGPAELEAEFWRIVEEGEDVVEVLYGADLDTVQTGSGFPRAPPLGDRWGGGGEGGGAWGGGGGDRLRGERCF